MHTIRASSCLCGLAGTYADCCGRYHSGSQAAATAETLMRSRYSAYAMSIENYLLATWHAGSRPASLDFSDSGKTKWLGLEIKRYTLFDASRAQVEFVARYKIGGQSAVRLHEISDFVFEDGRWFYVSGVFP